MCYKCIPIPGLKKMNYLEPYLPEKQASISFHWLSHSCIKLLTKPSQLVQSCHAAMLLVKCRDVIGQLQLFISKAGLIITLIAHTEPTAQISRMGALNLSDSTPCYSRLQFIQCVTRFSLLTLVYIWILRPHLIQKKVKLSMYIHESRAQELSRPT